MAQASVQYTPVQVLQAARRAEAEGKMDYALQFYRHIVEHHGTSVEAQEAREGLFRIAEWRWGEARVARRQESGGAANAGASGSASSPSNPSNSNSGYVGQRAAVAAVNSNPQPAFTQEPPDQSVPMTGATRMPQIIARESAKAEAHDEPLLYKPRYRVARVCALLVSASGWATLVAGIAIAVLGLGGGQAELSATALLGLPLGLLVGAPAVVSGLVLIVAGLLAVAVFESTNAAIEQLTLRRRR